MSEDPLWVLLHLLVTCSVCLESNLKSYKVIVPHTETLGNTEKKLKKSPIILPIKNVRR